MTSFLWRKVCRVLLIICSSISLFGCSVAVTTSKGNDLSPYDFGLAKAKTGEERFQVLFETHKVAVSKGVGVSYQGIKSLDIVIPKSAKSIPLSEKNDFGGVVFNVTNRQKDFFLFEYIQKSEDIIVNKRDIDMGVFKKYPELSRGRRLLVVSDAEPWVLNREGYSYGHTRKDILLVDRGKARNKTVMPYNNDDSSPVCKFYTLSRRGFQITGITLNRSQASQKKTYLCRIQGVDNLTLKDVTIATPPNMGENDVAITIVDCTNVSFDNVVIDGTYSRSDHSGYGVSLNNIWNFKVRNMYGHGNWGVFGTNNVNVASFEDSDINRFDIHCYGRDVFFKNVTFRDKYNQFGSVYGTIEFESCNFIHFCPVLNGDSYNTYVGYDIIMNDCNFYACKGKTILFNGGRLSNVVNQRRELAERCLPNISINNLTVYFEDDDFNAIYLMFLKKNGEESFNREFGYISDISVSGVKFVYMKERIAGSLYLSNVELPITAPINSVVKDIDLIGNSSNQKRFYGSLINKIKLLSPSSTKRESNVRAFSVEN